MKTLGGRQFWGDVRFFRGWRIQQNVFTEHYRLLDPRDHRHAFGSLQKCIDHLEQVKSAQKLPPMSGKAVIVIHGITRSSKTFTVMRPTLEKAGYMVVGFDYPSTRIRIDEAAEYLNRVIRSLDGIGEIDIVAHSLGGLVTRAYLKKHRDPRIKRMVMLGVPNHGAEMADLLRTNLAFQLVLGPAGQQLVTGRDSLVAGLPIPDFEFAVIAGSGPSGAGINPLIRGVDDLLVSVESTRLPGAADSMTVRALHLFMPANAEIIEATVHFLNTGSLRKSGERQPIPRDSRGAAAARAAAGPRT